MRCEVPGTPPRLGLSLLVGGEGQCAGLLGELTVDNQLLELADDLAERALAPIAADRAAAQPGSFGGDPYLKRVHLPRQQDDPRRGFVQCPAQKVELNSGLRQFFLKLGDQGNGDVGVL